MFFDYLVFWNRQISLVVDDSVLVQQLAGNAASELRTLQQMLIRQRKALRTHRKFVLGRTAQVSPFIVLLVVLVIPHADLAHVLEQLAPGAGYKIAGATSWIAVNLVVPFFVFVRFRALDVDETYSTYIALVESALDRAASSAIVRAASSDVNAVAPSPGWRLLAGENARGDQSHRTP